MFPISQVANIQNALLLKFYTYPFRILTKTVRSWKSWMSVWIYNTGNTHWKAKIKTTPTESPTAWHLQDVIIQHTAINVPLTFNADVSIAGVTQGQSNARVNKRSKRDEIAYQERDSANAGKIDFSCA
jgi:hypothetical protein